ncbi:MAG: AAA family ATPase, partial [Thermostichales cyanobacterium HHBFW_bins_127]
MGRFSWNDYDDSPLSRRPQDQDLLRAGWRPHQRQLDWQFLNQLITRDPWEFLVRSLDTVSDIANALGRKEYSWFANLLNLFSEGLRFELAEFWDYITPTPLGPDPQYYQDVLATDTPIATVMSRHSIPIDDVLQRLQEKTVLNVLQIVGRPQIILQRYQERFFDLPVDRFVSWNELTVLGTVCAYWPDFELWVQVSASDWSRRRYTLIGHDLAPLVRKATRGLSVMLSGYQSRVGELHSAFPLSSFPPEIQTFTDLVQQKVLSQPQLAVIAQGKPGTGKTAWTQAFAREFLIPLGYVVFILDHEAVENFIPPTYLERICLIINEADNLAQDRASEVAQQSLRTEHILTLLDGTLYQSVTDSRHHLNQHLVVLMTCNTTARFDPAV